MSNFSTFFPKKINEIMSGRCSKVLRIVSGAGDGKRTDDPEEADTEQGTSNVAYCS